MSIDDLATATSAAPIAPSQSNGRGRKRRRSTRLIKWAGIGVFILMNVALFVVLMNVDAVRSYLGVEPTVITIPAGR